MTGCLCLGCLYNWLPVLGQDVKLVALCLGWVCNWLHVLGQDVELVAVGASSASWTTSSAQHQWTDKGANANASSRMKPWQGEVRL